MIKILIVDDKPENLYSLDALLTEIKSVKYQFDIIHANGGEQALEIAMSDKSINLIILDIQMPDIDGFEVAKFLQSSQQTQHIPVIFLTAVFKAEEFKAQGFELGVIDYFTKPIERYQFSSKIRLYLRLAIENQKLRYANESLDLLANNLDYEIKQKTKTLQHLNDNLKKKNEFINSIINSQSNFIVLTDGKQLKITNQTCLNFLGYKTIDDFFKEHHCVCDYFIEQEGFLAAQVKGKKWIEIILQDIEEIQHVKMKDLQGNEHIFQLQSNAEKLDGNYVITFSDITELEDYRVNLEQKVAEQVAQKIKFRQQAFTDGLTQIPNRAYFDQQLKKEIARYQRERVALCLCILDLDHFKLFNDKYGHQIGDAILIEFAEILTKSIRIMDTFARWGGEEFALILPHTQINEAKLIAEKLRKIVEQNVFKNNYHVTCSFGVAEIKVEDTFQSLFKRADQALYQAKNNGRNQVRTSMDINVND